ncbi:MULTISPECIES: hypothetical protein [unclassified Leucobacter]|uniref:hypothetical protein n=1 Tax=unclassified Leucobacter TaxID=2621730 RepID=UPI00301AE3BF
MTPSHIDHIKFGSTETLTVDIDGTPHELSTAVVINTRALHTEQPHSQQTQPKFLQSVSQLTAQRTGIPATPTPHLVTEAAVAAAIDTARHKWDRAGRHEPLTNAITRAILALLNSPTEPATK